MTLPAIDKEELTTDEAIDYLEVSRNTFFKWRRAGKIQPSNLKEGLERQPSPLYRKADLDAFIAARREERLRREAQANQPK